MNAAAIAQHLNIIESAIIKIEEWANVLFVVCRRIGARFVSKKVVETKMEEYTDFGKFREALDFWVFSKFAGEKVAEAKRFSKPNKVSPFLPREEGWQLTTVSGKSLECTDMQKMQIKIPSDIGIKYTGAKHDQFESKQGFYW